jgi:hypothetical protein
MATNERVHLAASDWNFRLASRVISDLHFADWYALFVVLLNPVENLLFTMVVMRAMLPSLSWQLQSIRECRLHRTSWTVECPHQCIDRDRNLVFPFWDVTTIKKLACIGNKIVGKSCLCGRFGTNLVACKILRGVVRGYPVVTRTRRLFPATLSRVQSKRRIPRQCHDREIRQLSSRRQNARFGCINKQE